MVKIISQNLIYSFHLSIGLRVISRREIQLKLHQKKRPPVEMEDKIIRLENSLVTGNSGCVPRRVLVSYRTERQKSSQEESLKTVWELLELVHLNW